MPVQSCPYPNCTYTTNDVSDELAAVILKIHADGAHTHSQTMTAKVEKVRRPIISSSGTSEEWAYFITRWDDYKAATKLTESDKVIQLLECCDEELRKDLTRAAGGTFTNKPEQEVLKRIKSLAVRQENIMVSRVELHEMIQDSEEAIRSYVARLKGQANVCKFIIECPSCSNPVNYSNEVLKDVVVKGISDNEIQLDILSDKNQAMTLEEIVRYIEAKESGKRSATKINKSVQGASNLNNNSGVSQYKKSQKSLFKTKGNTNPKCTYCGNTGHGKNSPLSTRKGACPAYGKVCTNCGIPNHSAAVCRAKNHTAKKASEISSPLNDDECPIFQEICALSHHIYSKSNNCWIKQPSKPQPFLSLNASLDISGYQELGYRILTDNINPVQREVLAMPDTGCQSCLVGQKFVRSLGMQKLIPVNMKMSAANKSHIDVLGAAIVRFRGQVDNGSMAETRQIVYVTNATEKVYLSREACVDLGVIPPDFPTVNIDAINLGYSYHALLDDPDEVDITTQPTLVAERQSQPNIDIVTIAQKDTREKLEAHQMAECGCPKRSLPPKKPVDLPFQVTKDDIGKLKEWLLEYYKASSFNTCTHQKLPMMNGPPLRLMVDPQAIPVAYHSPLPVPLHWEEAVKSGLDQDVRLGVLKPVPVGQPVTWCHRMVVCAKKDGRPRRTVDLQSLNKFAVRETHHTIPPYKQARSVPAGKLKTVFDCWNGYHSIPLHDDDLHYTTFITPWGRYQYRVAPQGYIASGDGYCRRFDEIVAHIPQKTKCIDDTLLWSDTVEESFHQAVNWLDICGRNGIILNPDKFVFAQESADFAGFTITSNSVKPSSKYIGAVRDFPTPSSITDIRAWFGLVNQVAYTFAAAKVMDPFRVLLKSGVKFSWNDGLEEAFQLSKKFIVKQIEHGVRIFDTSKLTCLATDWCGKGVGYWMIQKHCQCTSTKPFCCRTGWKVAAVGSRFTNTAESDYSTIEGEALAVVYALEHARHFVLGCENLVIATDHKPLLGTFSDRSLDMLSNRLRNLKEKTLRYRFTVVYVPGAKHKATDALSRNPVGDQNPPRLHLPDDVSLVNDSASSVMSTFREYMAALHHCNNGEESDTINTLNTPKVVTWEKVKLATSSDHAMELLLNLIVSGFPNHQDALPVHMRIFFPYRKHLSVYDGVVLYKERIFVPEPLRQDILLSLHSAHQGVSRMISRAQKSVFWPGITADIRRTRLSCGACNRMTPSQPSAPPAEIYCPEYPFELICADYFTYKGRYYLVIVDRYTNWPIVKMAKDGSKGLIDCLRQTFATYGIPEELSSDGGLEFTSQDTQNFLANWGVRHRISSVAFPHSNCRAELGVKTAKRILADNTDGHGSLDIDTFQKALLSYRNTPNPETGISPSMSLFGRQIKDPIPVHKNQYKPHHSWSNMPNKKEQAFRAQNKRLHGMWSEHTKTLPPLRVGDSVRVQNQYGNHPLRWDRTGIVVEVRQNDQYMVRINGSRRASLRNRKFLRKFELPSKDRLTTKLADRLKHALPSKFNDWENQPRDVIDADKPLIEPDSPIREPSLPEPAHRDVDQRAIDPEPQVDIRSPGTESNREAFAEPPAKKVQLALRRLAPFNKKGLKE